MRGRGVCHKGAFMAGGEHGSGGMCGRRDMHGKLTCMAGGICGRGASIAGETATAAEGTAPTGMHSSFHDVAKCSMAANIDMDILHE